MTLCKTDSVDDYKECFLAHVPRAESLEQQPNMEMTMSLAQMYER
jgi:hypothetical protein